MAGELIAFFCADVILGTNRPVVVELTSSIAETLAEAPEVLMATPLWLKLYIAANKKNSKNSRRLCGRIGSLGFANIIKRLRV